MNIKIGCLDNQSGSATLVAILILTLLAIMGMSGARTASVEMEIAGNNQLNKLAFYSAEAARTYVRMHPAIYGVANVDPAASGHRFPNDTLFPNTIANPYIPITAGTVTPVTLSSNQSFRGIVQYRGPSLPPRGSGYDTSSFQAHRYQMTCEGQGPRDTTKTISAGFYRIGL